MRVGLVLYGSLDERSGGFRYDRKLVDGLRAAGDEVVVIELPWRPYPRGLLDNATPAIREQLDVDVDVMVQDELAHPSLVWTNRRLSCPIVSVVHHLRASESRRLAPVYRTIERRYLATVDGAVCNSEATRATVDWIGAGVDETVVAPPAGDRFDPDLGADEIATRAAETPLRVTFVGNVAPRKGLDTLIEGLAAVEPEWHLTVVGRSVDDDYLDGVRDQIRRQGIGSRVRLAGELTDEELAAVLRESHVLAVPSRHEGFGIVYLEGMSFGLPAVATSAGGASEVVTDGETGFLVDPDDPARITRAVDGLARDRERLAEMGARARRRYERHPGWAETTDRIRQFLVDVAGTDRPTAEVSG